MPFTQQELEDAYKQMQDERRVESTWAAKAAQKLKGLIGYTVYSSKKHKSSVNPLPDKYDLVLDLSQYDSLPQAIIQQLGMKLSMIVGRGKVLNGQYDLSADPDFANAPQQVFRVIVNDVDAHMGGW